jgi:hypothetical protein
MGGSQSYPFALVPAEWRRTDGPVVGAEALHAHFRIWLTDLGHDSYRDPAAATS